MQGLAKARRAAIAPFTAALVLAACATLPPGTGDAPVIADRAFMAEGRLTARHGTDAVSANFRWSHDPPKDELELSSPLGQIVADLSGNTDAQLAQVRLADGRTMQASDWAALTQRALGFPLPVTGLASWIRGGARAGSAYQSEVDARGRATLVRQDGWEIVFDYADAASDTPARMRMTYPDVEVRIALNRPLPR